MKSREAVSRLPKFAGATSAVRFNPLLSIVERYKQTPQEFRFEDFLMAEHRANTQIASEGQFVLEFGRLTHVGPAFLELGGHEVFFDFTDNYLDAYAISDSTRNIELELASTRFSKTQKAVSVQYSIYRGVRVPNFSYPRIRVQTPDGNPITISHTEKRNQMTRAARHDAKTPRPGLSEPRDGFRWGYVFSTCVEFYDNFMERRKPEMNTENLCWMYDLKQENELLPILPTPKRAPGNLYEGRGYLIERHITEGDGSVRVSFLFTDFPANQFTDLSSAEWTDYPDSE